MLQHGKSNHNAETFTCCICNIGFTRRDNLLRHNRIHNHLIGGSISNSVSNLQRHDHFSAPQSDICRKRRNSDNNKEVLVKAKDCGINERLIMDVCTNPEYIDINLQHPMNGLIAGATQSGKSFFVAKLIKYHKECITPPPSRIIWCYTEYQPKLFGSVLEHTPTVEFHEGMLDVSSLNPSQTNLVILDDLLCEISNNKEVTNLFIRGSHHRNTSVFILMQNLYYPGKEIRTLNLNAHYLVLFKTPRDRSAIMHLARQIAPTNTNYVIDAFNQAISPPYGYLFVDLKPNTVDKYRLRTGILPGEEAAVFVPKSSSQSVR